MKVRTWMSGWRDKGVSLEQELWLNTDKKATQVYTDWEFIASDTSESLRTPTEVLSTFFATEVPGESAARPDRQPFPEPPPRPEQPFTAHRRVRWHQLNLLGYMDAAHYLNLLEEVLLDAAEYVGWPIAKTNEYNLAYFAKAHHVDYIRPATIGDELRITTYIGQVTDTSHTRHYLIDLADGQPVARAQTEWITINSETGHPMPIPDNWLEDFSGQMSIER